MNEVLNADYYGQEDAALDNVLDGGSGNDVLIGQGGDDLIIGGTGNDQITGGMGSDVMVGGAGNDTFSYGSNAEGGDIITDFETGKDIFVFSGEDFAGFGEATVTSAGDSFSIIGESGASINFNADTNTLFYDSGIQGEGYETIATVQDGSVNSDDIAIG